MKLRFVSYPMLLLVILAGLLAFQPLSLVLAAAGDLDPDFGTDGKVISDWYDYSFTSAIQAVAVQPDGKIIVAGVSMDWDYWFQSCKMARYNTDGSMDTVVHGTVFEGDNAVCSGAAVQSDGKIVVAGWAHYVYDYGDETVFAVARYNTDGYSPDIPSTPPAS